MKRHRPEGPRTKNTAFAALHLPYTASAGSTFVLGAAFTLIDLRWRNIWPLGLWHGWLGVFFYRWVWSS
jgi:uncharacterized protein